MALFFHKRSSSSSDDEGESDTSDDIFIPKKKFKKDSEVLDSEINEKESVENCPETDVNENRNFDFLCNSFMEEREINEKKSFDNLYNSIFAERKNDEEKSVDYLFDSMLEKAKINKEKSDDYFQNSILYNAKINKEKSDDYFQNSILHNAKIIDKKIADSLYNRILGKAEAQMKRIIKTNVEVGNFRYVSPESPSCKLFHFTDKTVAVALKERSTRYEMDLDTDIEENLPVIPPNLSHRMRTKALLYNFGYRLLKTLWKKYGVDQDDVKYGWARFKKDFKLAEYMRKFNIR